MLCFFLQCPSTFACRSDAATSCCLIFQLRTRRIPGACSFWTVCTPTFMCFHATSKFCHWLPYAFIAFCPMPETSLLRRVPKPLTLSQAYSLNPYARTPYSLSQPIWEAWVAILMLFPILRPNMLSRGAPGTLFIGFLGARYR